MGYGQYISVFLRKKAGNGNRTRMASLEGWNFTIKLCPRRFKLPRHASAAKFFFDNSVLGGRTLSLAI